MITYAYTNKTRANQQEKSASDMVDELEMKNENVHYLEEVILEKVSHGLVGRHVPPGIEVEVEDVEPGHQHQGTQLGLVPNRDQDHQNRAHQILDHLHNKIIIKWLAGHFRIEPTRFWTICTIKSS
jgi:hypothetical protein